MKRLAWAVATWFGCGLVPIAPGTAGTLAAVPLYLLAAHWGWPGVAVAATVVTFGGVWAASVVAQDLGKEDPQVVVVDEVAGLLLTMLPAGPPSWRGVVAGVLVFRVLDVLKPGPVRLLERLPSGWGVVMDDVGAGVLGAGVLWAAKALGAPI